MLGFQHTSIALGQPERGLRFFFLLFLECVASFLAEMLSGLHFHDNRRLLHHTAYALWPFRTAGRMRPLAARWDSRLDPGFVARFFFVFGMRSAAFLPLSGTLQSWMMYFQAQIHSW